MSPRSVLLASTLSLAGLATFASLRGDDAWIV